MSMEGVLAMVIQGLFLLLMYEVYRQFSELDSKLRETAANISTLSVHRKEDWMSNEELINALNKISHKQNIVPTYTDCSHALREGQNKNGIYQVSPVTLSRSSPFNVYCDMETDGGGWLVFQRRKDGSVDFFRTWDQYKEGFGKIHGEMWLGNDKLYQITSQGKYTLRIELKDFEDNKRYAEYKDFYIGDEFEKYKLHIGTYSGNAGDSFTLHNGMYFSTNNSDHDMSKNNCAAIFKGAWWFEKCHLSHLNGQYLKEDHTSPKDGIDWIEWKGLNYSYKETYMMIRR